MNKPCNTANTSLKLALLFFVLYSPVSFSQTEIDEALNLSLSDLLSMEVTTVSKKSQALNEVASAVFIITQDDIRRSGVTSIPEALRMAPGIQVARIDSNKWAISSRGFGEQHANKLLVLIDGRSVYTTTFSGVYWEVQDTVLNDIERIEVIRGPGATVWGANAVNGIINIITKSANQTNDGLVDIGLGDEDKMNASFRYGLSINDDSDVRFYLKQTKKDSAWVSPDPITGSTDGGDNWQSLRSGFRIDTQTSLSDNWTLQGDIYKIDSNQILNIVQDPFDSQYIRLAPFFVEEGLTDSIDSSGWNVLGRWKHSFSEKSSSTLQVYYDRTKRSESFLERQNHKTFDIDFQFQREFLDKHALIMGLGYRQIKDNFKNSFKASVYPTKRNKELYSAFIQDEIALIEKSLYLTLGTKFEENYDTGTEVQPSARVAWLVSSRNTVWAAISRAIRSPSRFENDSRIVVGIAPIPPTYSPLIISNFGTDDFDSEVLEAIEIGHRMQFSESFSTDLAIFYNDYKNLRSLESAASVSSPFDTIFGNKLSALSYGFELSLNWQPKEWFSLQTNYSYIDINASSEQRSDDLIGTKPLLEGSSPAHQVSIRSTASLMQNIKFDLWFLYIDNLAASSYQVKHPTSVASYNSINSNLRWQIQPNIELALIGKNLFNSHHTEFIAEHWFNPTEIESSLYAKIEINF